MLNTFPKFPDLRYWSKYAAFRLAAAAAPGTLVLAYHRISRPASDPLHLGVSPANFESQIQALKKNFSFISPAQFLSDRLHRAVSPRTVLLTFDDGYRDNFTQGLPILARLSAPGLFFITNLSSSPWWDETAVLMTTADLARFSRHPLVTLGGHTRNHHLLSGLPYDRQLDQIKDNYRYVQKISGTPPLAFAYPFGNISFYDANSVAIARQFYPLAFTTMPYMVSRLNSDRELPRVLVPDVPGYQLISYLSRKVPGLSWLTASASLPRP